MEQQPPTAPFTLHWVWYDNEWCLARRDANGSTFTIYGERESDEANAIMGPTAGGVIQPPPLDKPVYREMSPVLPPFISELFRRQTASRAEAAEDGQRETESPQTPAGGKE
jgi:hypothetical protein